MNKNLQSPTKLTEFAPLQPEEKPQSVGQFITKFFKLNKTPTPEEATAGPSSVDNVSQESLPAWAIDTTSETPGFNARSPAAGYPADVINEGRSLPNVLRRISNLLALKSNNLQDYEETDLKQYWMPDSVSKECYACSEKFTTFRRRHHCRVCGQIFCSQCCNKQISGNIFGCTGDLRVCGYCDKVVTTYLQSLDPLSPTTSVQDGSIQNLRKESLEVENILKRKISVGYQEEIFATGGQSNIYLSTEEKCRALQNSASLRNLFEEICRPTTGVPLGTHRYRLRTYTNCFLGTELVDWLIYQQKANTRVQAAAICQALLEGGYIECVSDPCSFVDGYALYKPGTVMSPETPHSFLEFASHEDPSWIQQIPQESSTTDSENEGVPTKPNRGQLPSSSSYMLDLNVEANTVYLSRQPASRYSFDSHYESDYYESQDMAVRTSEQREFVPEAGWHNASNLREENGEKLAYDLLTEAYHQHEQSLLKQLLSISGLSLSWTDVLIPLTHEVINVIRPDKSHYAADLDVRHYIKFKKLSGGARSETKLIRGIVCSKNVAHKGMATEIDNPKILLLNCSVAYQRTEGRLMSLEPVLMQEHEYLRHAAARIVALQPDLVLVHRNVSRLAQDLLREHGITLVHNVKRTILDQLARCTDADLVTSVDSHIGRPRLGVCKRFYIKNFRIERGGEKTLMFFEGLAQPHMGATIKLRGAPKCELARVQNVTAFFIFATYNWRLEKSFLMDEFAAPPNSKYEFLDDSKENSPTLPKTDSVLRLSDNKDSQNKCEEFVLKDAEDDDVFTIRRPTSNSNEAKRTNTQAVEDFTDPLQAYSGDDDANRRKSSNKDKLSVADLPFSNNFRKALDDTILCISPYLMFSVPYLETEMGRKCKLRAFFPSEIYYSEQFNNQTKTKINNKGPDDDLNAAKGDFNKEQSLHPFLTSKLTSSIDSNNIQGMLAHFRACGGLYEKREILIKPANFVDEVKVLKKKNKDSYHINKQDVLEINNHQRLAVLFCSFTHESPKAPEFCVSPWIINMNFYGYHDISLGCYLEKYCFRPGYSCPSQGCDIPMTKHVRRFVHNAGCVSVTLNKFDNEFVEENVVMWTWCTKCQSVSPVVPMSSDTWSFSFAKYLELRFYGGVYGRRGSAPCRHSLHHDHYQYFGFKNSVASFKYNAIQIWEISLPPRIVSIDYNGDKQQAELIDDIRVMAQKGHEIYSVVLEKLSSMPAEIEGLGNLKQLLLKEQGQFKQKVEDVQLKLTSPTIESKDFDEMGVFVAFWNISDSLIRIKRLIVETVDTWNLRLSETARRRDSDKKSRDRSSYSDVESPTISDPKTFFVIDPSDLEGSNQFVEGVPVVGAVAKKNRSLDQAEGDECVVSSSPKTHQRSQSDGTVMAHAEEQTDSKKDSDKITVKNILSQLLPSSTPLTPITNPFNPQEHYTLPTGVHFPIVVYESEPSSIIAYALNSFDYKRCFEELTKKLSVPEQTPSPVAKRKSPSDKEKGESAGDDKTSGLLGFLRNKDSKSDLLSSTPNQIPVESRLSQTGESSVAPEDPKKPKNSHIEIQFQDSNCNFFCRVFFAEKFVALRNLVLSTSEEAFIRSLTRSVQWNARGGKSGSNFAKTTDDRFILKEMSKTEIQLFQEWAPNYFSYMHKCYTTGQPTLLGRIVGIYQIVFKNNTSASLKTHLLVMENLFYNRTVSQKFDLKGCSLNRMVIPDNQEGEIVLLDENLLKMTCDAPLYILPHSKAVLTAAIQNDTEFLSSQCVMDYSLLVGLDSENRELVLGIIDYIRTFTWDKKLETMVKNSAIWRSQGKSPTIISPVKYQKRFIEAMHRYFLEVPDRWTGLGKGLEF